MLQDVNVICIGSVVIVTSAAKALKDSAPVEFTFGIGSGSAALERYSPLLRQGVCYPLNSIRIEFAHPFGNNCTRLEAVI
jgi:hypothetical protein